jgi:hypothetical protein
VRNIQFKCVTPYLLITLVNTTITKELKINVIFMQSIFWTLEEVARRAKQFYERDIRRNVEYGENIGKMIVIDAETGEYGIDATGVETALKLKQKNPNARLFTMRIGYDVAVSFGGTVERTTE